MRRLIWTAASLKDLRVIDTYLTQRSPAAAVRTLEAISAKAALLERFPAAGPVLKAEFRTLSVTDTPYLLVYRIDANSLQILRVRHEREDWR